MSGSGSAATYTTGDRPPTPEKDWTNLLMIFNGINIIELAIVLWVLLSMIIYGSKTRRWWKSAGSSILNSGIVYATCTVAVAAFVLKLASSILLNVLPRTTNSTSCEVICDIDSTAYTASTYSAYFFLWLKQRMIYRHPYVEDKLKAWVNWTSKLFVILLTVFAIALVCFFLTINAYERSGDNCVPQTQSEDPFKNVRANVYLAIATFAAQLSVMCFSIYPAVVVKFETPESETETSQHEKWWFKTCLAVMGIRPHGPTSPIERSVRRMVASTTIMMISGTLTTVIALLAFPPSAPVILRQTIYDIGGFTSVFCILATFGFSGRVLTLFCSACGSLKLRKTKRQQENATIETSA